MRHRTSCQKWVEKMCEHLYAIGIISFKKNYTLQVSLWRSLNSCQHAISWYLQNSESKTMRQLKHHEKKLLRKVSLYSWKGDDNIRVAKIMRKYHIQNREDYTSYTRICGMICKLAAKLKVWSTNLWFLYILYYTKTIF